MRPGTLAVVILLLLAILAFGFFLITYDNGRPEPGRPPPTSESP